jgi:DNA (cytosine-5)-methyltransferase 1
MQESFRFIDLCAGIGGLRIPFDGTLGKYVFMGEEKKTLNGKCVFTAEIDGPAKQTYSRYFANATGSEADQMILEISNNLTTFAAHEVPDHELLLAGFPCQPFSHAGLRKGFEDDRGNIFRRILDIVVEKKPRVILLENVRGLQTLKNEDGSKALETILEDLRFPNRDGHYDSKVGDPNTIRYFVPEPKLLNARDFGLAQNRSRLFIVAIRSDVANEHGLDTKPEEFIWPEPTHDRDALSVGKFLDRAGTDEYIISDRLWLGHQNRKARNVSAGKGWGYQLFSEESKYVATISARYFKDGSEALIRLDGSNPRKLTPNEARKLQGFPDDFLPHESKMQAFRQFGNAVPVSVIQSLAINLKKYLASE